MADTITKAIDALTSAAFIEGGVSIERTDEARERTEQCKRELITLLSEPQAVAAQAPEAAVYAEARECSHCNHVGINDSADGVAACISCAWHGDSPKDDKCPECEAEGTMTASCPKCHHEYRLLADASIATQPAATESVLIEGVAYTIPEAVAHELLRLNIELVQHEEAHAQPQVEPVGNRETFEKWASGVGFDTEHFTQSPIAYSDATTEDAWGVWQASRPALATTQPAADELNCVCGATWFRCGKNNYEMVATPRIASQQAPAGEYPALPEPWGYLVEGRVFIGRLLPQHVSSMVDSEGFKPTNLYTEQQLNAMRADIGIPTSKENQPVAVSDAMRAGEQEPVAWPKDAKDVRAFFSADFITAQFASEDQAPCDEDRYTISAHDFLSAVNWWADFPHVPRDTSPVATQGEQLDAARYRYLRDNSTKDWAICEWLEDPIRGAFYKCEQEPHVVDAAIDAVLSATTQPNKKDET